METVPAQAKATKHKKKYPQKKVLNSQKQSLALGPEQGAHSQPPKGRQVGSRPERAVGM